MDLHIEGKSGTERSILKMTVFLAAVPDPSTRRVLCVIEEALAINSEVPLPLKQGDAICKSVQ